MDFKKLEEFVGLAKKMGVARLEYKSDDEKFVVELPNLHAPIAPLSYAPTMGADTSASRQASPAKPVGNFKEITSPFVGTFYRSSSPSAPPMVKVGDKIAPGKALCIIEAMKIMNEIEADLAGEVVEICVENETYVEFGQVLFKIKT